MKKLKGVIISVLISIFIINIVEVRPKAEDEGYYIKNMQVDVEVNDKRQFFITETIDVYFNEDRHGIKRDITTSSGTEECSISDISVIGAPYESTKESGNVSLKIGDEDETIDGDKRYIIKYTLNIDITGNIWYNESCKKDIKVHRHQNICKYLGVPLTEYWKYSVALWLIYSVL